MSDLALDFLTHIESREARLLGWGFVDGRLHLRGTDSTRRRVRDQTRHIRQRHGRRPTRRTSGRALLLEVRTRRR